MRELKILSAAGVFMFLLAACATTPDTGDFMRQHAAGEQELVDLQSKLAKDWTRGSKLVVSGEKRVQRGEAEIERGKQEIAEGKMLMQESERIFREKFPGFKLEEQE